MLTRLKLNGYKSIRSLDLELNKVNVLIGANGSGKSNLISFFKLLRWMLQSQPSLQLFIGKYGWANSFLFDGKKITNNIEADIIFQTEAGRNDYYFRLVDAAGDTLIFTEEKYRFSRTELETLADWQNLDSGHKESKLVEKAHQGNTTAKTIFKLLQSCVVYQFHDTSETARIKNRWNIDDNQYLKEDGANLAPVLLKLRENEPKYYQKIVETLTLVLPFFADFVLESINHTVMLQWREKESDLVFSAYQASDGMLRIIALITALLQPPKYLPKVLIIDEPELGLHPYAINIIGELIKSVSYYTQVIIATQSTLLVDCFEPEDIIVVERKERESIFKRLDSSLLKDWLEEYTLSELWTKNVIGGRPS